MAFMENKMMMTAAAAAIAAATAAVGAHDVMVDATSASSPHPTPITRLRKMKSMILAKGAHPPRTLQQYDDNLKEASQDPIAPSVFDPDISDPALQSNREELINTTAALEMKLTYAPTSTSFIPTAAPPSPTTIPYYYHAGPHLFNHESEDVFSPTNDDPPGGGGGYFGPSYSGNNNKSYSSNRHNADETDFKEFIAFVGWYAFLIFCCLLPTVCAYYRRRRNAYVLRENFLNIQSRLAEIERRRNEELETGSLGGVDLRLAGENRDRDWEFIEQLFGPIRATDETNNDNDESAIRRRMIMTDILGGMSVRMLVERDRERRRERGRRLVAALKETSLMVRECHLIAKSTGGHDEHLKQQNDDAPGLDTDQDVEGDIEMGSMACEPTKENDDGSVVGNTDSEKKEDNKDTPGKSEVEDLEMKSGEGGASTTNENESKADTKTPAEKSTQNEEVEPPSSSNIESNNSSQNTTSDDALPTPVDLAVPAAATTMPQSNPTTSLYEVDDPYDDDEDNKYSAICLPCVDNSLDDSTSNTTKESRLTGATCAICLLEYAPGCYVSWSSNSECTHVFHRDCILMWLLKKEEPLCPCCRRDFVVDPSLNGGNNNNTDENNNDAEIGDGDTDPARRSELDSRGLDGALTTNQQQQQPSQSNANTQHMIHYSNLPGSFSIGRIDSGEGNPNPGNGAST